MLTGLFALWRYVQIAGVGFFAVAKIITVAETFDVMYTTRPYHRKLSKDTLLFLPYII
jgi:hypothetical protein